MKDFLKRCLANVTRVTPNVRTVDLGYRIYNYTDEHGNFDYRQYVNAQKSANREKCDRVWVVEENVAFLANYIRTNIPEPRFGICHGTRRGNEQKWFRQRLQCEVIGTEIADSAHDFPHTVRWDFHDDNLEWTDRADFVYSNSFDHSYDPERCLNTWVRSLRVGGLCILEHSDQNKARASDPLGVSVFLMPYLIAVWGQDRYFLKELIEAPHTNQIASKLWFLVIQRRA